MSGSILPPRVERVISDLLARVTRLERVLGDARDRTGPPELVFSYPGDLLAETSGQWVCRTGRTSVFEVVAGLVTAGTTDTDVEVLVNGSTALALTIPANATTTTSSPSLTLAVNDRVSVEIATVGDDAADLVVQLRFRYPK